MQKPPLGKTFHTSALDKSQADRGLSRILMSGKAFVADVSGALFWPAEETLIVSDLHLKRDANTLGAHSPFQNHQTRATLIKLSHLILEYNAKQVVILGDGLHPTNSYEQFLSNEDTDRLRALQEMAEWIWVTDSKPIPDFLIDFNATVLSSFSFGGLTFRHKPVAGPIAHEIAGSLHPIAKTKSQYKGAEQRCFVSNNVRIVMPSFAQQQQGRNVLDKAFTPIFASQSLYIWLIGLSTVEPVASRLLQPDGPE